MSSEQLTELLKVLSYVAGAVIATWKSVDKFGDYLINRDKQRSVGEEAIKRLNGELGKLNGEIDNTTNELRKLNREFDELTTRIWHVLTK